MHCDGPDGGGQLIGGKGVQVTRRLRLERPAYLRPGLVPNGSQALEQLCHLSGEQTAVLGSNLCAKSRGKE